VSFCERLLHCKDFLWRSGQFGRVQSFVRPFNAVHMTAGLDAVHGSDPNLIFAL